tara:strand:+ start:1950 stop:2150 length:201 start_codon:yes stop_codon:yes gene_type:complete
VYTGSIPVRASIYGTNFTLSKCEFFLNFSIGIRKNYLYKGGVGNNLPHIKEFSRKGNSPIAQLVEQ